MSVYQSASINMKPEVPGFMLWFSSKKNIQHFNDDSFILLIYPTGFSLLLSGCYYGMENITRPGMTFSTEALGKDADEAKAKCL